MSAALALEVLNARAVSAFRVPTNMWLPSAPSAVSDGPTTVDSGPGRAPAHDAVHPGAAVESAEGCRRHQACATADRKFTYRVPHLEIPSYGIR